MMDPVTLKNRGYAFLTFCEREAAAEAAKKVRHKKNVPSLRILFRVHV